MNFGALLRGLFQMFQTTVALSNNEASKQRLGQISNVANAANSIGSTASSSYYESPLSSVATFFGGEK